MRVNIRYSVEDKDLLNETQNLFVKANEKFSNAKDLVIRQMLHNSILRDTDKMHSALTDLRKAMLTFDTSLSEIMAILQGFSMYEKGELPDQVDQEEYEEG